MVMMDIGNDVSLLLGNPKLLAKLIVVGALTLNGILLHLVAFPMVTGNHRNSKRAATIASTLGAVSTASWLYASFVAVARKVAPYFSLQDFLMLYLLVLAIAVSFAILVVRNRLEPLIKLPDDFTDDVAGEQQDLSNLLLEVEKGILDLGDTHRRLRASPLAQHSVRHEEAPVANQEGKGHLRQLG